MPYGDIKIFYELELRDFLDENDSRIIAEIKSRDDNYILNVNESDYIKYLVEKFSMDNLVIDFENISVSPHEEQIPVEWFPRDFHFREERGSYPRQVIKYHIPFHGNPELLRCTPSSRLMNTYKVTIENGCICFNIINFYNNPEDIKNQSQQTQNLILQQSQNAISEVNGYNSQLENKIKTLLQDRKQKILREKNLLLSLGVPVRKKEDVPQTYSIPTPNLRKNLIIKPTVEKGEFKPEPTLDLKTYNEILQIIYDLGKVFERLPSTYFDKDEEALRDHILLYLEPRYEGTAGGEIFNKSGKTDILIRYQNTNVFIAECKIWRGIKEYLEGITQLLKNLTWRDSKAAVVLFVKNKEISSVLKTIENETSKHENHLDFTSKSTDSWFNFRFHIIGDRNREVRLAVLAIHIPPPN